MKKNCRMRMVCRITNLYLGDFEPKILCQTSSHDSSDSSDQDFYIGIENFESIKKRLGIKEELWELPGMVKTKTGNGIHYIFDLQTFFKKGDPEQIKIIRKILRI